MHKFIGQKGWWYEHLQEQQYSHYKGLHRCLYASLAYCWLQTHCLLFL